MAANGSITRSSISQIPLSLATVSIGSKPEHTLPLKINAIASAGFKGLELGFPDLVSFAAAHLKHPVTATNYDDLTSAARVVKAMCDAKGLEIMLLQPFANFEGWREGTKEHADAWNRAEGWIRVMKASGCKTLQVGSTDTPRDHPSWSGKREDIIRDLQELADKMEQCDSRIAYENWCWSTHAPDWRDVWEIVKAVDRANVGLCLDTFQSAGGEWADPTTEDGLRKGVGRELLDKRLDLSMEELAKSVPAEKIYLLQVSDAYKMNPPIPDRATDDGLRPRGQWSMKYRPVPFAPGAYLPVVKVARGILGTGFRGWFSVEVFDQGQDGKGKDYELDDFANECVRNLVNSCYKQDENFLPLDLTKAQNSQ